MRHDLLTLIRERDGRDPSPSVAIIDTQSVRTTEKILWGDGCPGRVGSE
jgi:hypothetical protein